MKELYRIVTLSILLFTVGCQKDDVPLEGNNGTFIDQRDLIEYQWVKIGKQYWMTENLAYLPDGAIKGPYDLSSSETYYYVYGYSGGGLPKERSTYKTFGTLYNWTAAQSACPNGWHLPNKNEWEKLIDYLGNEAGIQMKSLLSWNVVNLDAVGFNKSGFNALPAGYRSKSGGYFGIYDFSHFWSSSKNGTEEAWQLRLISGAKDAKLISDSMTYGYSVRCIHD